MFINFTQLSKSAHLNKINKSGNNLTTQFSWLKKSNKETLPKLTFNNYEEISTEKNFFKKNAETLIVDTSEKKKELVIQSDKQYEINGVIYAEGKVSVTYKLSHIHI